MLKVSSVCFRAAASGLGVEVEQLHNNDDSTNTVLTGVTTLKNRLTIFPPMFAIVTFEGHPGLTSPDLLVKRTSL